MMKDNFNNVPSEVFDWIQSLSFDELTLQQQAEVLIYFTRKEYDNMYLTARELKANAAFKPTPGSRKKELLQQFDNRVASPKIIAMPGRSLIFWQAAAVLLFIMCGWMVFKITGINGRATTGEIAGIDTVYVDREVKSTPEIIHDTVYLYKYLKHSHNARPSSPVVLQKNVTPGLPVVSGEPEVMPFEELESPANAIKGNSMKDDSLLKRYTQYSF